MHHPVPPHDVAVLDEFFERDVPSMLRFSRDAWLPELQTSFLKLASAIRSEDIDQVRFFTHRIRGCAAMGGAHEIVANMNEVNGLAGDGRWTTVRSRFRDANYLLRTIANWVTNEYNNLAS
ncbi:MAG: Hpt domain-containing protein [Candidatus Eremiobacteraeota bacterium]|nr:Hpt domain-containing protein [Candidatus Eremiobacteraeota bacterium]